MWSRVRLLPRPTCAMVFRQRQAYRLIFAAILTAFLCGTCGSARASELVYGSGRIVSADGNPISGAIVAIYDDQNKVVDYARTDSEGYYAIAVPKHVLHIDHRGGQGFIAEVFGGITHMVGGAASFVANPVRAGVNTVTSAEAANIDNPLTKGGVAVGGAVVDKVLFAMAPPHTRTKLQEERKLPGNLVMKVSVPGSNDMVGLGRIYWLQQTLFTTGGKQTKTLQAWLDPVSLTSVTSEKPSQTESTYLRFTFTRLEPSLAQPGDRVRIFATLPAPPSPEVHVVVVARNNRTGQKWELFPVGGGHYEGEMVIDTKFPRDDQVISILAYAAQPDHIGRRKDAESAIEGNGLWDAKKPFKYDPLLVVSRNRADVTLTVLPAPRTRH